MTLDALELDTELDLSVGFKQDTSTLRVTHVLHVPDDGGILEGQP